MPAWYLKRWYRFVTDPCDHRTWCIVQKADTPLHISKHLANCILKKPALGSNTYGLYLWEMSGLHSQVSSTCSIKLSQLFQVVTVTRVKLNKRQGPTQETLASRPAAPLPSTSLWPESRSCPAFCTCLRVVQRKDKWDTDSRKGETGNASLLSKWFKQVAGSLVVGPAVNAFSGHLGFLGLWFLDLARLGSLAFGCAFLRASFRWLAAAPGRSCCFLRWSLCLSLSLWRSFHFGCCANRSGRLFLLAVTLVQSFLQPVQSFIQRHRDGVL